MIFSLAIECYFERSTSIFYFVCLARMSFSSLSPLGLVHLVFRGGILISVLSLVLTLVLSRRDKTPLIPF